MKRKPLPSQAELKARLDYHPEIGIFVWRVHKRFAGQQAGTVNCGYRYINMAPYGLHGEHRLAWIYFHGDTLGDLEVDHIDGNSLNNSILNLRLATSSQQKFNSMVRRTNRSGLKGAYYHACRPGMKWRSQICVRGKYFFLGYFSTSLEAHEAYMRAAREHHGEFVRAA